MNRVKKIARRWEQQRPEALAVLAKRKAKTNSNRAQRRARDAAAVKVQTLDPRGDVFAAEPVFETVDGRVTIHEVSLVTGPPDPSKGIYPIEVVERDEQADATAEREGRLEHEAQWDADEMTRKLIMDQLAVLRKNTVAELKVIADRWELTYKAKARKDELVEAIATKWAQENNVDHAYIEEHTND